MTSWATSRSSTTITSDCALNAWAEGPAGSTRSPSRPPIRTAILRRRQRRFPYRTISAEEGNAPLGSPSSGDRCRRSTPPKIGQRPEQDHQQADGDVEVTRVHAAREAGDPRQQHQKDGQDQLD